jgi:hypothetical protein
VPAKSMTPPYIEYYIEMLIADGSSATFPTVNPEVNPVKISVKGVDPKDAEVHFLSPEPGETLAAEDLAVAISLMFTSDAVDKKKTRLYFDGVNVTNEALLSDDVLLYSPKNFNKPMNLGAHSLKVELRDTLGNLYFVKQTDFNLSTATAIEEARSALQYLGNGQLEFRNEKVDVTNTTYTRGDLHVNGTYKFVGMGFDMHVTNEEKPDRQPQNRFLGTLQLAEYFKLQIGDAYPAFPSLFISGKRVRGVTGSLTLGFFNLDVSYGKTVRSIEGTVLGDSVYQSYSSVSNDNTDKKLRSLDPADSLTYTRYLHGTYDRKFIAIRPSFGSGENFQWGFTYIRSTDDTNSVSYGRYPADNFVAGTDLMFAFDDQKIKWTTQVAFSLENTDISGGNFTDADYDSLELGTLGANATYDDTLRALDDSKTLKDAAKLAKNIITVNANLMPLDPITGLPTLAVESELTLNYFNNFIRSMVFRRGRNYKSYGNDFVQTDIAGFNVSDRIRLFSNRVMTSLSYETKWNNLQNETSKPRTTFNAFNGSITAYPGAKMPTLTIGYGFNTRSNEINLHLDTLYNGIEISVPSSRLDSLNYADEITNRYFFATNYDFYMAARQSFTASVSLANKTDNTFNLRNQDNVNISFSLTTNYKIPMQTTVAVMVSHNEIYSAARDASGLYIPGTTSMTFDYQTISMNARYRMFKDRLNLLATLAPSFGDFKRFLIQAGADYQLIENHYIVGQLDFIQNPGRDSDVIASLIYRFAF